MWISLHWYFIDILDTHFIVKIEVKIEAYLILNHKICSKFLDFLFSHNYSVSLETVASLLNSINTQYTYLEGRMGRILKSILVTCEPKFVRVCQKKGDEWETEERNCRRSPAPAWECIVATQSGTVSGGVGFLKGQRGEESRRPARRYIRCYKCHHKWLITWTFLKKRYITSKHL